MGGGKLETFGVIGEDAIVFGDGLVVIALGISDFPEIELGVGSQIGIPVVFEIVLKFLTGEIVFAAGDIAQTVGIQGVRGRRGARSHGVSGSTAATAGRRWSVIIVGGRRCLGRSGAGNLGVQTLHGVLQIDQLL